MAALFRYCRASRNYPTLFQDWQKRDATWLLDKAAVVLDPWFWTIFTQLMERDPVQAARLMEDRYYCRAVPPREGQEEGEVCMPVVRAWAGTMVAIVRQSLFCVYDKFTLTVRVIEMDEEGEGFVSSVETNADGRGLAIGDHPCLLVIPARGQMNAQYSIQPLPHSNARVFLQAPDYHVGHNFVGLAREGVDEWWFPLPGDDAKILESPDQLSNHRLFRHSLPADSRTSSLQVLARYSREEMGKMGYESQLRASLKAVIPPRSPLVYSPGEVDLVRTVPDLNPPWEQVQTKPLNESGSFLADHNHVLEQCSFHNILADGLFLSEAGGQVTAGWQGMEGTGAWMRHRDGQPGGVIVFTPDRIVQVVPLSACSAEAVVTSCRGLPAGWVVLPVFLPEEVMVQLWILHQNVRGEELLSIMAHALRVEPKAEVTVSAVEWFGSGGER